MKRKYSETQEERFSRMARERAMGLPVRKRLGNYGRGGGDGEQNADHDKVMRLIEEKRQDINEMLKVADIEIVLKHDLE